MSPAGRGQTGTPDADGGWVGAGGRGGSPGGVVSRAAGSGVEGGPPALCRGRLGRGGGGGAGPTSIPVRLCAPARRTRTWTGRRTNRPAPLYPGADPRGGGALAAVISLLIVIAVAKSQTPPDQTAGPAPGVSAIQTPQPTSRSAAPLPSLPKSAALSKSQMIVAMEVSGNWDLYLADESHNAPKGG